MHYVVLLRVDTLTNATLPGYLGLNSRVTAPYNASSCGAKRPPALTC
jgi:hypothetical protein